MVEEYKGVTSYQNLLDLNVKFLKGEIKWTPYHQKPLTDTNDPDLISINEKGFLALGGQCAVDTPDLEKKLFLDGYLDPKLVRNFIKYLKRFKKIEFFIEFPNKQIKTNIRNWNNKYNIKENQYIYFNSLTRVRNGNEWNDTDILPFRDISYITMSVWKGFNNILEILKDYAFVHIQHRSFHNKVNDLYSVLNGYLKSKPEKSEKVKQKNNFGNSLKRIKNYLYRYRYQLGITAASIPLLAYYLTKGNPKDNPKPTNLQVNQKDNPKPTNLQVKQVISNIQRRIEIIERIKQIPEITTDAEEDELKQLKAELKQLQIELKKEESAAKVIQRRYRKNNTFYDAESEFTFGKKRNDLKQLSDLKQLQNDLKDISSSLKFGEKKLPGPRPGPGPEQGLYQRAKRHFNKHRFKYLGIVTQAGILAALKYHNNKKINQKYKDAQLNKERRHQEHLAEMRRQTKALDSLLKPIGT